MPIPLSKDINIIPGVLSAGGTALYLNGLALTDSDYAPVGSVTAFTSPDDVLSYFGSASSEYAFASIYFDGYVNSTKKPGALLFARYNTEAVSAFVRSGSMASVSLDQLKLISGVLTLTVDGTVKTSTNIDLSGANSFAAAADLIESAIGNSVVVTFDTTQKAFVITSATSGAGSTITYATGTASTALKLTSATGAVLSQGAVPAVAADAFTAIKGKSQNWALCTTTFAVDEETHLDISSWVSAQNNRYGYVPHDNSVTATVSGSTDCLAYKIITVNNYANVIPVYGDHLDAAAVLGYSASLDFDRTEGRVTLKFRETSGLTAKVSDSVTYDALIANGYNFYGNYAENNINENYWSPGTVSGPFKWVDSFCFEIWLNANLLGDAIQTMKSNRSFPYNARGKAIIEAGFADTFTQGVAFGGIRQGVTLSSSQISEITNAVGADISASLNAKGYYLYIGDATPTVRAERGSPPMQLWYCDGGSVQKISLPSTMVQ